MSLIAHLSQHVHLIRILSAAILLSFTLWFLGWKIVPAEELQIGRSDWGKKGTHNTTLGFQEIVTIGPSLEEQTVRRVEGAANASDLEIQWQEVAQDGQALMEELPEAYEEWQPNPGEKVDLVSHLRAWTRMQSQGISSALLLQSDTDWDLRIHESLSSLATVLQNLTSPTEPLVRRRLHSRHLFQPFTQAPVEAFGLQWDIMFLGHCGALPVNTDTHHIEFQDDSSPSASHLPLLSPAPNPRFSPVDPGLRQLFQPSEISCPSTAYALSASGARKLLDEVASTSSAASLDVLLHKLCNTDTLACFASYPPLFSSSRYSSGAPPESAGPGIQISARVNGAQGVSVRGNQEAWIDEWTDIAQVPGFGDSNGEMDDYTPVMNAGNCSQGPACFGHEDDLPKTEEDSAPTVNKGEDAQVEDAHKDAINEITTRKDSEITPRTTVPREMADWSPMRRRMR